MTKWMFILSTALVALGLSTAVQAQEFATDSADVAIETEAMRIEIIRSYGTAYGMCDGGHGSYFCLDRIKTRAEEDARRQADMTCYSQYRGRLDYYPQYCSEFCSPFNIPPGAPMQNVSCRTNCDFRCVIQ